MKLSTRLTVAMVALVLLTATSVGYLTYRDVEGLALPRGLDRIDTRTRLIATELEARVHSTRADVIGFASAVAVEGIVRSRLAGGADPIDGTSEAVWRARMASRYAAELAAKPDYLQFRIIGVADGGREIVRVDRSGPDGAIRVVPAAELQRKGDRPYVQEAIKLAAGEVYVSPIDLNQENGVIETPHVSVLRIATPLHGPDGSAFGTVIINIDMRPAFARIRSAARDGGHVYLVNAEGDYLVHPDAAREFGFELGRPARVQDDFADFAKLLDESGPAPRVLRDRSGADFGVGWTAVRLAGGPRVAVIETIPYATLMAAATAVRNSSLLAGLAAVVCAIALAVLLTRSLTRPLAQMARAAEGLADDAPTAIPTQAGGEVGTLAQAFARMAGEVRDKTSALQDRERMARDIINTALDAVVQMDERGIIIDWNPQAEAVFGWPRAEAIGMTLGELIVPERHRAGHKTGLARYLRSGDSTILGKRLELEALRRDGNEIKVELSVTALRYRGGTVFNGFIRDLTERIAAEERARQSQKMEAVGQLVGGIAHDFNNMLTVITGTIEILADGVAGDPQLVAIARLISEAADRGAELTGHLLAFARKQPLQPRETDINDLIHAACSLIRPSLGEHIEIEAALEDDAWPALVDPTQLTTALINLAVNARDAMPGGGKLTLETKNVVLDESYAKANRDAEPGSYVMIAVSDTGAGIPAALHDRVFEPFFTTKEVGKGTGLGLSMVYGFVKQSSGHIKIYSEEGHGTTIKLYLPRAAALAERPAAAPAAVIERGSETVLIVEDDPLVRNHVTTRLKNLGYRTLEAANAAEAIAIVESGVAFDLLFTDVIMSGLMNGRQLADELARRRSGIKVLFTSGYTENAIVHHGRLDPGVLLLAKPYRNADLASMIRRALTGPAPQAQVARAARKR
ncbi:MAG TPA: PAS domain S-box protein [Xanthobacteraceae bacterium]